jgi:hypothetical protein
MHEAINSAEQHFPELLAAFRDVIEHMEMTFCKKQLDYGPEAIDQGDNALTLMGLTFRMNDKMARIRTKVLHNNKYQVDENLEDTLLDLANYAIIASLVVRGEWKPGR